MRRDSLLWWETWARATYGVLLDIYRATEGQDLLRQETADRLEAFLVRYHDLYEFVGTLPSFGTLCVWCGEPAEILADELGWCVDCMATPEEEAEADEHGAEM